MIGSTHELLAAASEKLHTPLLRTRVHISARVTVFLAAAGFGKTYAMADCYERFRSEGGSAAWLSCAALCLTSGDILHGIRQFFELFTDAETVFVDDLGILSPGQRKALLQAFVLTPSHRRIVLATRSLDDLGLPRLVADGSAQIIPAETLSWRRSQLAELWQNRLTPKQISYIDGIAQGWPAVSQLLARFIFKGGDVQDETLLLNSSLAADYIRSEVLANFTSSDLSLLSMMSLIDSFDNTLIKAFAKNSPLTCEELVRKLPGLCSFREDGTRAAFNRALALYLKLVFSSLPEKTRCMALRSAADWASAQGDVVTAGNLAARAGDRQRIVDFVTKAGGLKIWLVKGHDDLRAVVSAAGEALVAEEPRLKLLKCVVLLKEGRVGEAMGLFHDAAQNLPSDPDTERGAAFVRLSLMVYGCELPMMSDAEIVTAFRSFEQEPAYRSVVPTMRAIMHSQQADFAAASAELSVARAHAREAGVTYNSMFLDLHAAVMALAQGNLDNARDHLSKARLSWRSEYPNDHGAETVMLSLGAQLAFERGNIQKAKQHIDQVGHRLAHSEAWLDIYFAGYEPAFRVLAREQGLPTALAAIDRTFGQLQEAGLSRIAMGLRYIAGCLIGEAILRGDAGLSLAPADAEPKVAQETWQERELRTLSTAYGFLASQRPQEARCALDSLIEFADERGLLRTKLRALLLRQAAKQLQGESKSAALDFHVALEIGAVTGMRQAFLEFGSENVKARIAAGLPKKHAIFIKSLEDLLADSTVPQADGKLTRREKQVLELLTCGGSDKAIARQLHVTEYAVQFHLKNIYRKLGVHDRSSAITHHKPRRSDIQQPLY